MRVAHSGGSVKKIKEVSFLFFIYSVVWPSSRRPLMSPLIHYLSLRSKSTLCSFVLDFECGFWSKRAGITIAACKATLSSADALAKD